MHTWCADIGRLHTSGRVDPATSPARRAGSALASSGTVDRRNSSSRPGSVDDTNRVPVIEYARTRVFLARQARTPAPVRTPAAARERDTRPVPALAAAPAAPAPAAPAPAAPPPEARADALPAVRSGPLPHPRLVRRPRTTPEPAPLPRLTLRPASRDREFEEEPTDQTAATRSRYVTSTRSPRTPRT
jgi:hypothetical protein